MDYEKKLALAKEALESGSYDRETIEYIFPELKESEDEMIRKRIIHALHGDVLDIEETNKAIVWLEKQGEQKPAWSEEDERLCGCLIKDQEEALDEVRNDKYGHSEIISDLKDMYRERIDWLKTLKGRVQPQWKPSEEQLKALNTLNLHGDISYVGQQGQLILLYKELKKL